MLAAARDPRRRHSLPAAVLGSSGPDAASGASGKRIFPNVICFTLDLATAD
jgi:hypothetical protein